jgi:hypothetical protein
MLPDLPAVVLCDPRTGLRLRVVAYSPPGSGRIHTFAMPSAP